MGCGCLLSQAQREAKIYTIDELNRKIKLMEAQIQTARNDEAYKNTTIQSLQKMHVSEQHKLSQNYKVNLSNQRQINGFKNKLEQIKRNKDSLCKDIVSLQSSIKQYQQNFQKIMTQIAEVKDKIEKIDQNLQSEQEKLKNYRKQHDNLQSDLNQRKKITQSRRKQKRNLQWQLERLNSKDTLLSKINLLKIEVDSMKRRLASYQSRKKKIFLIFTDRKLKYVQLFQQKTVQILKKVVQNKYLQYDLRLLALSYDGKLLHDDSQKIGDISQNQALDLYISVSIAKVWEIKGLVSDQNRVDDISSTKGVVQYSSCRHYFSRQSMKQIINFQIKIQKMNVITCPFYMKYIERRCDRELDPDFCMLVAGYSLKQSQQLQHTMSQNWQKKNCKKCPGCRCMLSNINKYLNKARCPFCKSQFCIKCLQIWKNNYSYLCQSNQCLSGYAFDKRLLITAPNSRKFQFYGESGEKKTIYTPNLRQCPKCGSMVMNTNNCKHTPCICTTDQMYSFCFICLSVCVKGKWSCGGAYQYCGKVAPNC